MVVSRGPLCTTRGACTIPPLHTPKTKVDCTLRVFPPSLCVSACAIQAHLTSRLDLSTITRDDHVAAHSVRQGLSAVRLQVAGSQPCFSGSTRQLTHHSKRKAYWLTHLKLFFATVTSGPAVSVFAGCCTCSKVAVLTSRGPGLEQYCPWAVSTTPPTPACSSCWLVVHPAAPAGHCWA